MLQGVVLKAYGGFYYVEIAKDIWECRLRGRFRLIKQDVLAGDMVRIKETGRGTGVIEEVLPRHHKMDRPAVANVDQGLLVFACADPDPQRELLDRMLIHAEANDVTPVLCFNKADLVDDNTLQQLSGDYARAGYRVFITSVIQNRGIETVREVFKDRITVLAGPSGSGKSSLINAIHPGFKLKTGRVSEKIGRGRHTTRHVELMELEPGSLVVDTPGFSNLYMPEMNKQHLAEMFPEFIPYMDECRFNGCLHRAEPDCAVKDAVESGELSRARYDNYLVFLAELELTDRERRY